MRAEEAAPAKVNLFLHVLDRRADGRHDLETLVAFAACGERVAAAPADRLSLHVDGPFAAALADCAGANADRNLVVRAAQALARASGRASAGVRFNLHKTLPAAAGVGGGSSDAAAALRALARLWDIEPSDPALGAAARALGADVPMCLAARPAVARGLGHDLTFVDTLPDFAVVLANPGLALPTRNVFAALRRPFEQPAKRAAAVAQLTGAQLTGAQPTGAQTPGARACSAAAALALLARTGNDLYRPALRLAPSIANVAGALADCAGCGLARMSGSGPTCFGLFARAADAADAAARLGRDHPDWWVVASRFGPSLSGSNPFGR